MNARRSDDPVMLAARQLVETLAADPAFVTDVAEQEIARRVAAGSLIPAERLQVAPGLTLAPTGRIEALEDILAAILQEVDDDALPQALVDKATGLLDLDETDEPPALPGAPEEDPVVEEEENPVAEEAAAPDEPDPEPEPEKPEGKRRRLPDEPGKCTDCDTDLDLEQTHLSLIRFRKPLCKPCMASH